jgi:hypothetical protein
MASSIRFSYATNRPAAVHDSKTGWLSVPRDPRREERARVWKSSVVADRGAPKAKTGFADQTSYSGNIANTSLSPLPGPGLQLRGVGVLPPVPRPPASTWGEIRPSRGMEGEVVLG